MLPQDTRHRRPNCPHDARLRAAVPPQVIQLGSEYVFATRTCSASPYLHTKEGQTVSVVITTGVGVAAISAAAFTHAPQGTTLITCQHPNKPPPDVTYQHIQLFSSTFDNHLITTDSTGDTEKWTITYNKICIASYTPTGTLIGTKCIDRNNVVTDS